MQTAYLQLKLSWELFQKAPETLSPPERTRLVAVADKQAQIERRILTTAEAAQVVIPAATLAARLGEIRQRYAEGKQFEQDLDRNGLDQITLEKALESDLRVEAVLEKIAASTPAVSEVDAEIYFRLHPDAFDRPEARRLRHILITFNSAAEKARASTTLTGLRGTLTSAGDFAQAALRHSQCPTAMDGGILGLVKRDQLYPELEPAAFALAVDELSDILESPMGLHLLRCDEILPSGLPEFAEVCPRIIERLGEKRRREAQRDWIKALFARA